MIQPEFKPLIEILSNKLFRIPEYQRHYSWEKPQLDDLFDDINGLHRILSRFNDRIHFMATVVCLKTKELEQVGSSLHSIYDVVDGQQRLTTLVILLKAISNKLKESEDTQHLEEAKEIDKLLVKGDGRLIILQNNHDNRHILRNYLESGKPPDSTSLMTHADKNLSVAIGECEKFCNKWDETIKLLTLIKNKLYFVFQTVEDQGSVYTIFEVLNSRGLDVDWLDKCKSMLMGLLFEFANESGDSSDVFNETLKENHSYWAEIYREIGLINIPGHEIIRFAATLKNVDSTAGRPLNTEDSIDFFRSYCTGGSDWQDKIKRITEMTIWLKNVTFRLIELYRNKRIKSVTEISHARLLAIAIMLKSNLSDVDRTRLLNQWERSTFRIYGMFNKDSRNKIGDYVRAAKAIYSDPNLTYVDMLSLIKDISSNFPLDEAIKELSSRDAYNGWQPELRYFLYRYEEYLSEKQNGPLNESTWEKIWVANASDSIEHILPEDDNTYQLPAWNHFNKKKFISLRNSLGNLMLLPPGLNSEAGRKPFTEKKQIYERVPLFLLREVTDIATNWNEEDIMSRQNRLLEFAKDAWSDLSQA